MVKGIVRKLDELGRITFPKEHRDTLEIGANERMGMNIVKNVIHFKKADRNYIGIARRLDSLGRYCIPIECRRSLHFADREFVDMYIEGNEICIRKASLQCVMCGSEDEEDLLEVDEELVCKNCAKKIMDKLQTKLRAVQY